MDAEPFVLLHAASDAVELQALPVPPRPVFLRHGPRREPRLTARRPGRAAMSTTVVLEPIVVAGRSQLLMLCKAAGKVGYNGRPAQAITLLSPRDEFRVGGHTFFVTTAQQPRVGSPTAGEVGTPCPVCLVQIDSKTRIYRCHDCATTVHHEDETWDEEDRLECAQLISECPNCRNDIEFESTGSWVPQW